jgi:hypothetical protein
MIIDATNHVAAIALQAQILENFTGIHTQKKILSIHLHQDIIVIITNLLPSCQ